MLLVHQFELLEPRCTQKTSIANSHALQALLAARYLQPKNAIMDSHKNLMIIEQPQLYILLRTPTLNGGTPAKTMQKIALNMFDIHFRSAAVWEGKLMDLTYYVLTHSLAFLSRPTFLSGSNRFVFFHKWIWKDNLDLRVRNHNIPLLTNHSFSSSSFGLRD